MRADLLLEDYEDDNFITLEDRSSILSGHKQQPDLRLTLL
jgi:hypothetical protein